MPCNHKFQEDLNLERINFEPTTLIIGTFNPEWPEENNAEWFYGRTHDEHGNQNNYFWDVLPRVYEEPSLINATPAEWKQFCERRQIAITDLITCIEDAVEGDDDNLLRGYADRVIAENFQRHIITDVINILDNHPTIAYVYITNGVNGAFWNRIWRPISQYCLRNDKYCKKLLTPSRNARFSMFSHNRRHPDNLYTMANLNDYILMKWKEEWHF